jgi:predicted nuclease of predicted toxin-antitoxin system
LEFVADESCTGSVIKALRIAGHDVIWIAETSAGSPDEAVIEQAMQSGRVLITEDRDFGELVFARTYSTAGVLLIKFRGRARDSKPNAVLEAIEKKQNSLRSGFTVVEPGRVRTARRLHN